MNSNTGKVSAVITTHNRLGLLKRAIDSVLSQTYANIECIVVSDASTDGTDEYCKSRDDIRFISIPKSDSHGGNHARNLGIRAASGEYVAFLDDDDAWLPTKIEKQVALLKEKSCECVYCLRKKQVYINNKLIKVFPETTKYAFEGDLSKKVFRHFITSTSCILAKKSLLEEIGGFDENLLKIQEYELLIRIAQKTEIYYPHNEMLVLFTKNLSDKARISNDPKRLPVAKKYIEKKHSELLRQAGLLNRFLHYAWMWKALYISARMAGDNPNRIKYGVYYRLAYPIKLFFEKLS